jgi:hypothetical protein
MKCDICVEGNIETKGCYTISGITVCNPCLTRALIFYCDNHKAPATNDGTPSESTKDARKEDKIRGWWA